MIGDLFRFAKFAASIMETVDCVDSFTGSTPALLLLFFFSEVKTAMISKENSVWLAVAKSLGLIFYGVVFLVASVVCIVAVLLICVLTKKKR